MKKIVAIVGARPQFIKHFSFEKVAKGEINLVTIHTGQHYDANMSSVFFNQLNISEPKYVLQNGGGNHGEQTGRMMIEIEKIIISENPDGVIVYGDTNSTLAGALVAAKLQIPIYHIEAGLRSYNMQMPEEINRILTDHISSVLFVTSDLAKNNLIKEGISSKIILVGDIMKDLVLDVISLDKIGKKKSETDYIYATIHRPYNTDNPERLITIFDALNLLNTKVIIALHPRTRKLIGDFNIEISQYSNLIIIEPQSYFDNLNYMFYSNGVITDSGGIQKEAYWLKKKCITIRSETEWTETLNGGWNRLVFNDLSKLDIYLSNEPINWDASLYGDGNTSRKILTEILKF